MSQRLTSVVYFNNCHNFDHAANYVSGAFFDLDTEGQQGDRARDLPPGQLCVVAKRPSDSRMQFSWYELQEETILPNRDDYPTRVFIGRFIFTEELPTTKARRSVRYSAFFRRTGDLKQGSVFHRDLPLVAIPSASRPRDQKQRTFENAAGFGDFEENKLVELAAIRVVVQAYEKEEWNVQSVEREGCGFDLECTKNGAVEHVEVKGVRGTKQGFIITSGEFKQATINQRFYLVVVTSALSDSPSMVKYSGAEVRKRFKFSPIQFKATLRR